VEAVDAALAGGRVGDADGRELGGEPVDGGERRPDERGVGVGGVEVGAADAELGAADAGWIRQRVGGGGPVSSVVLVDAGGDEVGRLVARRAAGGPEAPLWRVLLVAALTRGEVAG
jgi:hypothetical protein